MTVKIPKKPIEWFEAKMNAPVGITVLNSSTVAKPAALVRVVLKRKKLTPLGYYILTGFPK